jgi:hypothetical protein
LPGDYSLALTLAAAVFSQHFEIKMTPGQQARRLFGVAIGRMSRGPPDMKMGDMDLKTLDLKTWT